MSIETLFEDFSRALTNRDAAGVAALVEFPAVVVTDTKTLAITSQEQFLGFMSVVFAHFDAEGFQSIVYRPLHEQSASAALSVCTLVLLLTFRDGHSGDPIRETILVRTTPNGLRLVGAIGPHVLPEGMSR